MMKLYKLTKLISFLFLIVIFLSTTNQFSWFEGSARVFMHIDHRTPTGSPQIRMKSRRD